MKGSILEQADDIIHGERHEQYGPAQHLFASVAGAFTEITGKQLLNRDVILIMVLIKLARNQHKTNRDNLVDAAGYIGLLGETTL